MDDVGMDYMMYICHSRRVRSRRNRSSRFFDKTAADCLVSAQRTCDYTTTIKQMKIHYFNIASMRHHSIAYKRCTPCPEKKRPEFFLHNFNKFRPSVVIFGKTHPEDSFYYKIENLFRILSHHYVVMT